MQFEMEKLARFGLKKNASKATKIAY